jgi:hypothetical protein
MHEEKIINELIEIAYKSIQRTKGAEYAPNVHEIQLCINQYVANKLSQKLEEPKQQTAVEWLLNAIETKNGKEFSSYYTEFIEQAKEMDKEQKKSVIQEPKQDFERVAENKDEIGHIGHRMYQKLNEEMEEWMRADGNNKDFTLHEQALELRELGFDEPCFGSYIDGKLTTLLDSVLWGDVKGDVPAPTYSQVFRWFREKYGLNTHISIEWSLTEPKQYFYIIDTEEGVEESKDFNTYEEAELECLKKLIIETIKNKQL